MTEKLTTTLLLGFFSAEKTRSLTPVTGDVFGLQKFPCKLCARWHT
jgi:hypothetical protein